MEPLVGVKSPIFQSIADFWIIEAITRHGRLDPGPLLALYRLSARANATFALKPVNDYVVVSSSSASPYKINIKIQQKIPLITTALIVHLCGPHLGYTVKVKYHAMGEGEQKARRAAIAKVIVGSMKRMKSSI